MVLRDWLEGLGYELVQGSLDREVTEVVYDSRKVVFRGLCLSAWREPGWIPTGLCPRY